MDYCYKHFTFAGVHPHKSLNKYRVVFYLTGMTFVFALGIFNFYQVKDLRIVESYCAILIDAMKYISIVKWRNAMKKIENTMESFWTVEVKDAQITFLLKHFKIVKTFYYYIFIFGVASYVSKPLITRGSSIFNCYIPPMIPFPLFYVLECYLITVGCSCFVAFNLYACFLIITIAIQFRLLNLKIEEIGSDEIENQSDLNRVMRDFKALVEYQQFLMRFVKDLNKLLSVPVLLLMGISISMVCINMYVFSINQGTSMDKGRIILISSAIIGEYFMVYGLPAQLLMDESALTANMIYSECKWYLPNLRPLQKVFLLMILRSQKGVYIRAGNYHVINNQTIVLLLKTAYTFYAFLQEMTDLNE